MKAKAVVLTLVVPMMLTACGNKRFGNKSKSNNNNLIVSNTDEVIDLSKPQRECIGAEDAKFVAEGVETKIEKLPAGTYELRSTKIFAQVSNDHDKTVVVATDFVTEDAPELFSNARLECSRVTPFPKETGVTQAKQTDLDLPTTQWHKIITNGEKVNISGARFLHLKINQGNVPFILIPNYVAKTGFTDALKYTKPGPLDNVKFYKQDSGGVTAAIVMDSTDAQGKNTRYIIQSEYVRLIEHPIMKAAPVAQTVSLSRSS